MLDKELQIRAKEPSQEFIQPQQNVQHQKITTNLLQEKPRFILPGFNQSSSFLGRQEDVACHIGVESLLKTHLNF